MDPFRPRINAPGEAADSLEAVLTEPHRHAETSAAVVAVDDDLAITFRLEFREAS